MLLLPFPGGRAIYRPMNRAPSVETTPSAVAEAQRLYREFHARCFWSYRPDLLITPERVPWVRAGLRRHGGMAGWRAAEQLASRD
jgi:hypothetical protein